MTESTVTRLRQAILDKRRLLSYIEENLANEITVCSRIVLDCLLNKNSIFWCGNGGSASDCEHLSAELTGRFKIERNPYKSISLTSNSASMSSVANDYSFDVVFSRQVQALCQANDVLICLSTSGNSKNVLNAINQAKSQGVRTICLIGNNGGSMAGRGDHEIIIPSNDTARVQECQMFIGHLICEVVEAELSTND